jgi:glycosyltransferase involved in cell wall biosynthesis
MSVCVDCAILSGWAKTLAYATGFRAARGRYLFTLDADLQEDPSAIPVMLALLRQGVDMVVGWRKVRRDSPLKVLASWVFNAVLRWGLRLPLHDANCGFKGMRHEVADALLPYLERDFHRYLPLIAHRLGFRVAEVVVAHRPRALRAFPLRAGALRSRRCWICGGCCDDCESATITG